MIYAPIIIPTMCRATHFIRLVESLKRNSWACYTDVYVGLDYPPSEKYEKGWTEICKYLEKSDFSVFKKFIVFKRDVNLGAPKNSAALVQYVQAHYDRWIQTDDDCEFSKNFLEYMDKCLYEFEEDENIFAVTGYSYPLDWNVDNAATCFSQNFNVAMWGTGFWREKRVRADRFVRSGEMLGKVKDCVNKRSYECMLDACLVEYVRAAVAMRKPWLMTKMTDVALRAYLAIENKYCISPVISKVRNYGFDGSGQFCINASETDGDISAQKYDYENQVIDGLDFFELVLDKDESHLSDNRKKLNNFDSRPQEDVLYVRRLVWLIAHLGLNCAKIYHYVGALFRRMRKIP